MRSPWAMAAIAVLACSSNAAQTGQRFETGREAIPAEWTVAEDTSSTGDITTASLQLPAAKEIQGLSPETPIRLVLRCLDGRVAAFIMPESTFQGGEVDTAEAVRVQLDSAPPCE